MSELDKAKDVSKLGQVSPADKTEASGDDLKLSQKIDFTKYPNLERISSEDLEALVTDKDGKVLSEEGLVAANKVAGEKNTDGIQKSDDEDIKAMQDMGNYYLAMKGKFGGHESLHEAIHDKDGNLKSEEDLKKLDEQVKVDADAAMKKNDEDNFIGELGKAHEEDVKADEALTEAEAKLKELVGEEEYEKIQEAKKEEAEMSGTDKNEQQGKTDLSDDTKRRDFAAKLDIHNKGVSSEDEVSKSDDAEKLGNKIWKTGDKKKQIEELEETIAKTQEMKQKEEEAKAKTQAEQNAQPQQAQQGEQAPKVEEGAKLKEYEKSNNEGQVGPYFDNRAAAQASLEAGRKNVEITNRDNQAIGDINHEKGVQNALDKTKEFAYIDEKNDPLKFYANMGDQKQGPTSLKDMEEKADQIEKGETAETGQKLAGTSSEKEFDPYKDIQKAGMENNFSFGNVDDQEGVASQLQFKIGDAKSLPQLKELDSQIGMALDGTAGEVLQFSEKEEVEETRLKDMEQTVGKMEERTDIVKNEIDENVTIMAEDAANLDRTNKAVEAVSTKITDASSKTYQAASVVHEEKTQNFNVAAAAKTAAVSVDSSTPAYIPAPPSGVVWNPMKTITIAAVAMCAGIEATARGAEQAAGANEADKKSAEAFAVAKEKELKGLDQEKTAAVTAANQAAVKVAKKVMNAFVKQQGQMLANFNGQKELTMIVKEEKAAYLCKLAEDKIAIEETIAEAEKNQGSEKKEKVGEESNVENKQVAAADEDSFQMEENAEGGFSALKIANQLENKENNATENTGAAGIMAKSTKLDTADAAGAEKAEGKKEEDNGIRTIKFLAFKKESGTDKDMSQKKEEANEGEKSELANLKPALRMASRVNMINNVDGTAAKGFTA